jgi:amino acid transporter
LRRIERIIAFNLQSRDQAKPRRNIRLNLTPQTICGQLNKSRNSRILAGFSLKETVDPRARRFGLVSATCLVIANMVGAGVFTTTGFSLADIQNREIVLLAWCIGGLIAICGAVSYGKLSETLNESGGEYLFLTRMFHPAVGFVAGWISLLAGFSAPIALAAWAFETYAIQHVQLPLWYFPGSIAVALITLFGILHALGAKSGMVTQNIVIGIKLLLLFALIIVAWASYPESWKGIDSNASERPFDLYAFASSLVWISLSFSGFNCAVYIAGEIRDPKRNVFRSMLIGTAIVTVVYLALNFIFLYAPAYESVVGQEQIATIASYAIGGQRFANLVRIIILIALISSVSSMIVAGPRVYAKMASDGVFPRLFRPKDKATSSPTHAIWLQVAISIVFVLSSTLYSLIEYLSLTLSVSAALTVACLFWKTPWRLNRSRLWWLVPAGFYVITTLVLVVLVAYERPPKLYGFSITIATGLLSYFFFRYSNQIGKK